MATYATLESGVEGSRPLEIYKIDLDGTSYYYTSDESQVTVGGIDYAPIAIGRSAIRVGGDSAGQRVTITMPSDTPPASLYRSSVPGRKAKVWVWRLQRDESPAFDTVALQFKGRILSVGYPNDGFIADLNCLSDEVALNRNIPRITFMSSCNHVLYDSGCGVDPSAFDVIGTVSAESGSVITLPGASSQPDGFYTGGYCRPVSGVADFRLIIDHTGNDLTLLLPFSATVLGAQVQAFAGCDHTITGDCATKFDNVIEFGGFAFVPNRNVFTDGLKD